MRRSLRFPAAVAAILVAFATAGTGYAAFTASVSVNGTATSGTLGPFYWAAPSAHGFGSYDTCSSSLYTDHSPDDTLNLSAKNLAPGDLCGYAADLYNPGSLPATVTETITSASGALCADLTFSDNGFTPGVTIGSGGQTGATSFSVSAGGFVTWGGTIYLPSGAGDSGNGAPCQFTVAVTGSAGD